MIEKAGIGIAVKNGEKDLKAIADYITQADNNEGILKEVVKTFC